MPRSKKVLAPLVKVSEPHRLMVSLICCVLVITCIPKLTSAQEEPPQRIPAAFMSYLGADWLERPGRISEERPDEMLAAMGLKDGDIVADIGAGSGFHTRRMARLVAPTGQVFAVDIQPEMLEILKGRVEDEDLTGIVPVLGEFDDPNLPDNQIDWILLVDVYHEFENPDLMLAKMRQALQDNGKVALVEYRVEDGTGDHIKADHRMSVHQVLSEWIPSGFELIELHEFLPSQHLFIFQKAMDDAATGASVQLAIPSYNLFEAISERHVEVTASGQGAEAVSLTIQRMRPDPMVITLPVGTYFKALGSTSDMIARRDGVITLEEDGPQTWRLLARTVNRNRPVPVAEDGFDIHRADEQAPLRNVMWQFQGMSLHPMIGSVIEELALWIVSENAGYDDLVAHASRVPIPAEQAIALAAAYTDSAGIDITQKQIWADRDKFVPALTDEALKKVFEARNLN